MYIKFMIYGFIINVSIFFLGCSIFEEDKEQHLKILDTSCTEIWLQIKTNGIETVQRDGQEIAR